MQPYIEFRDITKRFATQGKGDNGDGIVTAVRDVTLSIAKGEVISLIGPSGCGKSTLLNMGSGLYAPSEGEVLLEGRKVTGPDEHVAFMLQKDLLLPWRTIRENIELGQQIKGISAKQRKERALEWVEKTRLHGFADHYPHQLSGGMRQRAALARTLAVEPTLLLMDEPFSALDAQTKMILQQDLAVTLAAEGKTALFITHDLAESVILSDRILVMSPRPGTIIKEITVDIPLRDNPMERRVQAGVADYVSQLMDLLHIADQADAAA